MSWLTRLRQEMIIETGDGQRYTPSWMNSVITQEFNFTIFEFPNVAGSFVRRREPKGRIFSVEIYFQGENCIELAEQFRQSAINKRQWRILHPLHDELRVQPLRLVFDYRKMNVAKITGALMETIKGGLPVREPSFGDEIAARIEALNNVAAEDYASQISEIQPAEINIIDANVDSIEETTNAIINTEEERTDFRNKVVSAKNSLTDIVNVPINAIRDVQAVINFPSQVVSSVGARVNVLQDQFNKLITTIYNLGDISRNNKIYSTDAGASLIGSLAVAATTNEDYQSRAEVSDILTQVVDLFDDYVEAVDTYVTQSQTQEDSYAPNPDVLRALSQAVNFSMANLQEIALDAKQEHVIITSTETNPILMSHRVYGQDNDDEFLNTFIETNNLGLRYLFNIPKDFELVYYV